MPVPAETSAHLSTTLTGARRACTGAKKSMPQETEDDAWNAGDLGCGELVITLRMRLRTMPGATLKLIATDAGAPEDIPAWCRMTGDTLLRTEPPVYWIRARAPNA
jgi:tRNA 2-thiouridine synthesizing protein A